MNEAPKQPDIVGKTADNQLARFVGLNVMGTLGSGAIGFITSVLLARWLGPAERGVLAAIISVSALTLFVAGIGVPWAIIYYANKRDPRALLGNSLALAGVLAVALIPAAWLLRHPLADLFSHGEGGIGWILAGALVPATFLSWTTHNQLQGMLLFGRFNVTSVAAKLAEGVWIVALIGGAGAGVAAGVGAEILGAGVMIAGGLGPILAFGRPRLDRRLIGAMLRYGYRVQAGSVFQQAIARVDILILQLFRPLSQVGYYVIAQIVAELVLQLTLAFQSSAMSLASHYEGDARQKATTADAVRHHGIVAGAACVANAGVGTVLIYLAYGAQYRPAIVPMLVLLPGVWFLGTAGVIRSDLSGRGHPGLASKLAGLATVLTLIGDFALIPPLGVIGAAIASVIAYAGYGAVSLIAMRRVSGIPVRALIVPTRLDLAVYWRVAQRTIAAGARRIRRAGDWG